MALQVWLPLNGNLNNQGLTNVSITNSGATVDSAGKIGSCYKFNGSSSYMTFSTPVSLEGDHSICCWLDLTNVSSVQYFISFGQYGIRYSGGDNSFLYYAEGITRTWSYTKVNRFVHVAFVCKSNWLSLYVDGVAVGSSQSLTVRSSCVGLGKRNDGYYYNGKLNDFRIYNHALSPKEVKEISKGLVLHYKLDDPYIEATTNIASSLTPQANIGGWGRMTATNIGTNAYHLKHTYGSSSNPSYWSTFVYTLPSNYANKTISFSVKLKNIQTTGLNLSTSWIFVGQGNDGQYPTHGSATKYYSQLTEYMTISWTGTLSNSHRYLVVELWNNDTSTSGKIEFDLFDIQIEEKDHVTPYTDGTRTPICYDCGGYGHDASVTGVLPLSSDTPRYKKNTVFNTANSILKSTLVLSNDYKYTASFWVKPYSINSTTQWIFALGNTGNSNHQFGCYINSTTINIQVGGVVGSSSSTWSYTFQANMRHHIAIVSDGTNVFVYVDGVSLGSQPKNGTTTGTILWLGQRPASAGYYNYNGSLSDFRIYATALSADDIKDLYQTSAAIHNTGTIDAFEFEEVDSGSPDVTKTGIFKAQAHNSVSKNLFDKNDVAFNSMNYGSTVTTAYTMVAYSGKCCPAKCIPIKPNTYYVLSYDQTQVTINSQAFNTVFWDKAGTTKISELTSGANGFVNKTKFLTPANAYFVSFSNYGSLTDAQQQTLVNSLQFEEGETYTTYTAHNVDIAKVYEDKTESNQIIEI